MHQERYISEKVAAMWNYPTRSSAVAGNPTRPIWTSAIFRRNKYNEEIGIVIYKNLKLDLDNYKVFVDDNEVILTKREFDILHELILNQGKILTREILMERVWQYEYIGNIRIVDNHIKNIRKKIGDDIIQTIRGVGYKIDKIY